MILSHWSCGCALDAKQKSLVNGWYTCPNHRGAKLVAKSIICQDCGWRVMVKPKNGNTIRCKNCQDKFNNQNRIPKKVRMLNLSDKRVKASQERSGCIHRGDCLLRNMDSKISCLPCLGCNDYEQEAYVYIPAYRQHDPYLWAEGV
jgi:DNA-directed RNA polymerase subunit RPC12/RpoP